DSASETAANRIAETFDTRTAHIDERLSTMDKALGIGLDNVSKMIDGKAAGLASSLRSAVVDATTNIDETAQRAIENVASKGLEYTDEMAARSAGFSNTLASHSEDFARTLAERAEEFAGKLTSQSRDFARTASTRSEEF